MRSTSKLALLALALITLAGAAPRVHAAANPNSYQSVDERSYGKLALALAEDGTYYHRALRGEVHWPPGAPALFAAAHALRPVDAPGFDVPSAYAAQAVVAIALIPAVYVLGALLGGAVAGVAAAAMVAGYPPLAGSPGDLLSEPLGALLAVVGLVATLLALRRPAWWGFAAAGLVLGALVLTRADLLLAPVLAAATAGVAMWRRSSARDGLIAAGSLALGAVALAGPWSWYVSQRTDSVALVTTGGSSNLFIGTYLPGDGRLFGVRRELAAEVRERHPGLRGRRVADLPQTAVIETVRKRRPHLGREQALRAAARENLRRFALGRPVAFAGMMARKADRLWRHPTGGGGRRPSPLVRIVHLVLVAVAAAGLVAGLTRRRARDPGLVLVGLLVLYVTALNSVMVSEPRHNLTLLAPLFAAGAAGWIALRHSEAVRNERIMRPKMSRADERTMAAP